MLPMLPMKRTAVYPEAPIVKAAPAYAAPVVIATPIIYKVAALLNLPMLRNFTLTNIELLIITQKTEFNAADTADAYIYL